MLNDKLTTFWAGMLKKNPKWFKFVPNSMLSHSFIRISIDHSPRTFTFLNEEQQYEHVELYVKSCHKKDYYCDTSIPAVKDYIDRLLESNNRVSELLTVFRLLTHDQLDRLVAHEQYRYFIMTRNPLGGLPVYFIDQAIDKKTEDVFYELSPQSLHLDRYKKFESTQPKSNWLMIFDSLRMFLEDLGRLTYAIDRVSHDKTLQDSYYYLKHRHMGTFIEKTFPNILEAIEHFGIQNYKTEEHRSKFYPGQYVDEIVLNLLNGFHRIYASSCDSKEERERLVIVESFIDQIQQAIATRTTQEIMEIAQEAEDDQEPDFNFDSML